MTEPRWETRMKASDARPLSSAELEQLRALMQRWVLVQYPVDGGSSEESDAIQTYEDIRRMAEKHVPQRRIQDADPEWWEQYGKNEQESRL